jgi:hypothetical protein
MAVTDADLRVGIVFLGRQRLDGALQMSIILNNAG